jgi:hypothetical protein
MFNNNNDGKNPSNITNKIYYVGNDLKNYQQNKNN